MIIIQFLIVAGFSATGFATPPPLYPFMRAVFLTPASLVLSCVAFYIFGTLYRALFTALMLHTPLNVELGVVSGTATSSNNAGGGVAGAGNAGAECSA